jgi:glyoxylase-like metal-dependent hydrolase (beta-lactamase superfamily II)
VCSTQRSNVSTLRQVFNPYDPAMELPSWATLVRAPNPGPMTLDGTNTWVLRGAGADSSVVVDPGPDDLGHLLAVAGHAPIGLILLTHGHPDHVDGAGRLADLLGGVAIAAADARHGTAPLSDRVDRAGLHIEVVRTPGHTADSVCFVVDGEAVLTGDTILGRGTTVVAWPDGNLADYLASLRALARYGGMPVLPGHGPVLDDCGAVATAYLKHREERLGQVRAAVEAGDRDAPAVVRRVYADVDPVLWPAAELSVRAQLAYLERESSTDPRGLDEP